MNDTDRRFWPFRIRNSFLASIGMLVGLLIILGVMKWHKLWPISETSDTAVLIGALIISLLPILLSLVDIIIERGGVFEAGGVKIDFSNVPHTGAAGFTVPSNIGVPGQAVQDSFTTNILDAQSSASRANSRRSTGPRSERGKAVSSRNSLKPRPFSEVVARSMEALGERPTDFEQMHKALAAAMEPRDGWEAAWVQDIAILRWRLERLQRAEVGVVALRRRRLQNQRLRAAAPPTGSAALELNNLVGVWGFAGIPDSAIKSHHVISAVLTQLRDTVKVELFEDDDSMYFKLLYGKKAITCIYMFGRRDRRLGLSQLAKYSGISSEIRTGWGALVNFAVHLTRLGDRAVLVSAVGKDSLGDDARKEIAELG